MTIPYRSQWDADSNMIRNDCGPACVAMVLQSLGQNVPINEITSELTAGADIGTTADELKSSLDKRNVKTTVWRGAGYPTLPAICLVKYSGFKRTSVQDVNFTGWHWLILLAIDAATVTVHDPDWWGARRAEGANKVYSRAEFDAAFVTRIAVTWEGASIVATYPIGGTVTSDMPFLRVRDAANGVNIVAYLLNGLKVELLAEVLDTKGRKWYQVQATRLFIGVYNDEALIEPREAVFRGWCAGWLITPVGVITPPPPVTPPPPATTGVHHLGYHVINYARGAVERANKGDKFVTVMDDEMTAAQIARDHPDCTVLFRRYIGSNKLNGDQLANRVGGIKMPNVYNLGYCEADSWGYGTPKELSTRIRHDLRFADLMLAQGKNVGVGTFSMGCPDYTKPWVIDMMKLYAPVLNRKVKPGDPNAVMDLHLYSPWANRIAPTGGAKLLDVPMVIRTGMLGSVKHYRDKPAYARNTSTIATWAEPVAFKAAAYNPNPAPTEMDIWFELRWMWLYTACGLDPEWARIVCSETGLDEGGVGGFPAHDSTQQQFNDWCRDWIITQQKPIVVSGKQYPSPFLGATIFQYGKGTNMSWLGYDVARYIG